jgi:hypothetical protein
LLSAYFELSPVLDKRGTKAELVHFILSSGIYFLDVFVLRLPPMLMRM